MLQENSNAAIAQNGLLVEGRKPIFHCIMDREKYGLTDREARFQDMADEYAILAEPQANGGLIVYGKYNGEWIVNPWSCRFLVRELLERMDIRLPPLH